MKYTYQNPYSGIYPEVEGWVGIETARGNIWLQEKIIF